MPALPPVTGVVRVEFKFSYSGDLDVLIRQFYSYSGGVLTNSQALALATAFAANYNANCLALASPEVELVACTATALDNTLAGTGTADVSYTGTASGTPLAAGTAMLINLSIDRRYRGGKPRNYWPFGTSSSLSDATNWSSDFLSAVADHYGAFIAANLAFTDGSIMVENQVNVSYYEGFTTRPDPPIPGVRAKNISTPRTSVTPDPVTGTTYNVKPASQRRRNTQKR